MMLNVQKIDQFYGSSHTLRGVSLEVRQGECMALLGRNGVGKTTLLQCLMGVQPVAAGTMITCSLPPGVGSGVSVIASRNNVLSFPKQLVSYAPPRIAARRARAPLIAAITRDCGRRWMGAPFSTSSLWVTAIAKAATT